MGYCEACGRKLKPNAKFCEGCGKKLVEEEEEDEEDEEDEEEELSPREKEIIDINKFHRLIEVFIILNISLILYSIYINWGYFYHLSSVINVGITSVVSIISIILEPIPIGKF